MPEDLWYACRQYRYQEEIGHIRLGYLKKFLMAILLIFLLPLVAIRRVNEAQQSLILDYGDSPVCQAIYDALQIERWPSKRLRNIVPLLPRVFYSDLWRAWKNDKQSVIENIHWLGVLALRVGQHYRLVRQKKVRVLLVMQEYSPYMRYLTRLMESEGRLLVNIMHGLPGKEAAYFRFSKCLVWSNFFKEYYINNYADPGQFLVCESIYHQLLARQGCPGIEEDIDILYMMQGREHITSYEYETVMQVLKILGKKYTVVYKQHPIYKIDDLPSNCQTIEGDMTDLICRSKIVLSHHSTSLFDALVLNKNALAFTTRDRLDMLHFMPSSQISTSFEGLMIKINTILMGQNLVKYGTKMTKAENALDCLRDYLREIDAIE